MGCLSRNQTTFLRDNRYATVDLEQRGQAASCQPHKLEKWVRLPPLQFLEKMRTGLEKRFQVHYYRITRAKNRSHKEFEMILSSLSLSYLSSLFSNDRGGCV